ncbi:MAG TPA: nickel pincer cofactor biosynthesis protein LarC, partial [Gammaproteobacteria bacterium]|nr:nickel pincer cofactor biosynthesis protein LarC [Gammaproteobacteria bacterium]
NVRVTAKDQHDHRHHSTIQRMIRDAGFSPSIERRALDIFQLIANAEGKIHGIAPDDVHFHEVGAIDSIVDIVAAAICIDYLQPDVILCNPVEVGSGFVDCAHGRFPVPAPATQELLVNAPCTYGGVKGECTTPTGAAILAASVDEYAPRSAFKPSKIGYGIGVKDFEIPNVLRVALGAYHAEDELSQHIKLEANIDDMSPEAFEPLMNALFDAGAADVYLTPIVMKKSRSAQCLCVLCETDKAEALSDLILNQSTTIGLRQLPFSKRVLPRYMRSIDTQFGVVRVKEVTQPNGRLRWKLEHQDVLDIAASRTDSDYQELRKI